MPPTRATGAAFRKEKGPGEARAEFSV